MAVLSLVACTTLDIEGVRVLSLNSAYIFDTFPL